MEPPTTPEVEVQPVAIYLAGPMLDFTEDFHHTTAAEWRESLSKDLPKNILLFSPAHAFFGVSRSTAPAVDLLERHVLAACDGVLVNLTEDYPAFGSIRDIEFGKRVNKPIAVAGDVKSLMAYDLIVKDTIDEAFHELLMAIADIRNQPHSIFGMPILRIQGGDVDES